MRRLVDASYGTAGQITCNILPAPEKFVSTANEECRTQNLDEANRILDEAGCIPGEDGVRAKDGVRISILYQTTTNSVRQGTQALIQGMWERIGVETILRDIEAAAFFDSDPESPDTYLKFYADVQMYTNGVARTDPEGYLSGWTCDTMPTPENRWLGSNIPRSCVAEYDELLEQLETTATPEGRAEIAILMNDIMVQNYFVIPLVWRAGVSAHASSLQGVRMNGWDSELWNIADWHR